MKISKIVLSTTLLSVSLFALPNEGELLLPPKVQKQGVVQNSYKQELSGESMDNRSSDEIIQMLDDVNKKRIEYEDLKSQQREKEKQKNKDYVLEQLKKDNEIFEEKLKTLSISEKELQKIDELDKLKNKTLEGGEYRDAAKVNVDILKLSKSNIKTEYSVAGNFTVRDVGGVKSIKVPGVTLGITLEMLMTNLRDISNIDKQILYYQFVSKNTNIDFLKDNKKYEELYNKVDYTSLKGQFADAELVEFKEGDIVYGNIIITNVSNKNYTLKYVK